MPENEVEHFKSLIQFMYTGSFEGSITDVYALLYVSKKYLVNSGIEGCAKLLLERELDLHESNNAIQEFWEIRYIK